jgi:imidazolonepropionase-like amidohydrolase
MRKLLLGLILLVLPVTLPAQNDNTEQVIRARAVIDGKGQVIPNGIITVRNGKIVSVGTTGTPSVDLGNLTVLPGFIDVHVHIGWHFDDDGRYHAGPEPAERAALFGVENAYVTLINGFTTVQSVGAASDKPLRDAINRGVIPGPRILSSLGQISNNKLTPDQIREQIRKL